MDGPENEFVIVAIKKYENEYICLLISPYFFQLKHCRIVYNICRDAWRRVGCCISCGCGDQGNLIHMHDFFGSGDIAPVSIAWM